METLQNNEIVTYNYSQTGNAKTICHMLYDEINKKLPTAHAKLFHSNPVWFIDDNPIVGYDVSKNGVNLLFWSGQSFDEPDLISKGKFKAAGVSYTLPNEINASDLERWLDKSKQIQWDYKNIRAKNGVLDRVKT